MNESVAATEQLAAIRMGLRGGLAWGAINVGAGRLVQFVSTIILARILAPEHFGVLAVALVVQTIAINVSELGATAAISRGDRDPAAVAPTVFTISVATSTLVALGVVFAAPLLAASMGDPDAGDAVRIMAITIALAGLSGVPAAMVWRAYLQRQRAFVEVSGALFSLALVVPMAMDGWGAFALVWSRVLGQVVITIGYWIITPRRFGPGFNRREADYILRLGAPLAVANLVAFTVLNLDYVIVSRMLGAYELGIYLLAFGLASLPSSLITAAIRTVALPTFGRLHTVGRLGQATPTAMTVSACLGMPISAGLAVLAGPLIAIFYGPDWSRAAAVVFGLAIFGAGRILTETLSDVCVGAGKTVALLWIQVLWFVLLVPALVVGAHLGGIAGVALGHALVMWAVVVPTYIFIVRKSVQASLVRMFCAILLPVAASLIAGVVGWFATMPVTSLWLQIIFGASSGFLVYLVLTYRFAIRNWKSASVLLSLDPFIESPIRAAAERVYAMPPAAINDPKETA